VQHFSDETLFFVFYSQPRDAMQEAAAEQLYKRNWRYHKDLHLWLTKDVGTEPTQKTATYERGSYIFFDPNTWEKVQKEFVLVFEHLETRVSGHRLRLLAKGAELINFYVFSTVALALPSSSNSNRTLSSSRRKRRHRMRDCQDSRSRDCCHCRDVKNHIVQLSISRRCCRAVFCKLSS
jgi:hypothetical protein